MSSHTRQCKMPILGRENIRNSQCKIQLRGARYWLTSDLVA